MLSVSRLIRVTVNLSAQPAAGRSFTTLMIAGDSNVISGLERYRPYSSLEGVGEDFGVTTPEYQASSLYFGQNPKPSQLFIGRWLRAATAGFNLGAILTPAQQAISAWSGISTGSFHIAVDGAAAESLTGLDFTGVTNLNGVASVINGVLTGATAKWNGSAFQITSSSTGPGAQAAGTISLNGQPSPGDSFTIDGTAVTFVASSPVGNQVVIGAAVADTFNNLLAFLQQSLDVNISLANYAADQSVANRVDITYKVAGTAGNTFSLVKSGTNLAVSAADLSGGTQPSSVGYATVGASGVDISAQLGLTAALSQGLAAGYALETPAACIQALATKSTAWYGCMFAASVMPTAAQSLAVSAEVEAFSLSRVYGVSTQDTGCLSALVTNDIASLMKAGGYNQSCVQFSSSSLYVIASLFGRAFSVDFNAQNSTIELMYKQEPGVVAENLVDGQANALQAKNCNVFAAYDNGTAIIQYGVMSGGDYFDEIQGLDWFQNAVQTSVYNLLYTAPTKIPQTEAGQNQLVNSVSSVCGNQPGGAVFNGLAGPGVWNSTEVFGSLQTGQYLPLGFYVYTPSVNLQSESDRAARVAPPIMVALKLAGAFQEADVIVTVNR